ncbi:7TM diverse intracellular signaling domain-containing protein [Hugenholtzia roseola]|uniref:7TM diverse intracellular signaling domain-containing protein n=1 Tax=Hugenholtzia roseola TaxID=1002 RepID=UPI0003FD41EA|nr:7TM diverse intracellular signaling domain-containing protein [Hugenholtzia roseola]
MSDWIYWLQKSLYFGLLLFIGLCVTPLSAQQNTFPPPIKAWEVESTAAIGLQTLIYEDPTAQKTVEEVLQNPDFFKQNEVENPNFGYTDSNIWFKFSVQNENIAPIERWLEVSYALLDSITLYEIVENKVVSELALGDGIKFSLRPIDHPNVVYPLQLPAKSQKYYLMRVRSQGTLAIPLQLWAIEPFFSTYGKFQIGFGIYYGTMLVMLLYNLFIFFSLKDRTYLLYVANITVIALFQLSFNGIGFQYLWSETPAWQDLSIAIFVACMSIFSLSFSVNFLNTRLYAPTLHKIILALIAIAFVELALTFFVPYKYSVRFVTIFGFLGSLILIITGFRTYLKGYKASRFFLLAWIVYLIGVLLTALRAFGILPTNFVTLYSVQIGSALEVVLLSLGLADRINMLRKELADKAIEEERLKREHEELQRRQIVAQKQELERLVAERTADLAQKTQELEVQNQNITDSIQYAKRIQQAILPTSEQLSRALGDGFIYFRPRDLVSGDFYWFSQKEDKMFLAVADCTGHGVPGALMSMIGNTLLNQIVNEKGVSKPAKILELLHKEVQYLLKQDNHDNNPFQARDGMDIALCAYTPETHCLEFAGANRPIWLVQQGTWQEVRGDKRSIGGWQKEKHRTFTNHIIDLKEGETTFYLSSDGYYDQFGGAQNRKFMRAKFRSLLMDLQGQDFKAQKQKLEEVMQAWKGNNPQIDDILVVGFKIQSLASTK